MTKLSASAIIWITGAGKGLGAALAVACAKPTNTIILSGRNEASLSKTRSRILAAGGQAELVPLDVRNDAAIRRAAKRILTRFGKIDALVNNAGVTSFKSVLDTSAKEFDEIIDVNLRAYFLTTKAVLPAMLRRGRGAIVNVISYAAKATYKYSGAYTASKMGAEGLMNVLRAELRQKGISVFNIFPGATDTPIWPKKVRGKYKEVMMTPDQIASIVAGLIATPPNVMIEEIIIRPAIGDLQV